MKKRAISWLSSATDPQVARIRSELAVSGGAVLMVVHPFFHERDPALTPDRPVSETHQRSMEQIRSRTPQYEEALARKLRSAGAPHVGIVLEELHSCQATWERLPHGGLSRQWWMVPTLPSSPTPWRGNLPKRKPTRERQISEWRRFGETLRRIGCQRIEICGAYFSTHPHARQCVDGAVIALQEYAGMPDVSPLDDETLVVGELPNVVPGGVLEIVLATRPATN